MRKTPQARHPGNTPSGAHPCPAWQNRSKRCLHPGEYRQACRHAPAAERRPPARQPHTRMYCCRDPYRSCAVGPGPPDSHGANSAPGARFRAGGGDIIQAQGAFTQVLLCQCLFNGVLTHTADCQHGRQGSAASCRPVGAVQQYGEGEYQQGRQQVVGGSCRERQAQQHIGDPQPGLAVHQRQ